MSYVSTISNAHIRKLDHNIIEIRLRALENIISKLNLDFECDCNAVKKELLVKLFKWFAIEPVTEEEKVLNLLIKLIKSGGGSYLNSFGKVRFQNELSDLRAKLDSKWHYKLNVMEKIVCNPEKLIKNFEDVPAIMYEALESNYNYQSQHNVLESSSVTAMSPLDSSVPFELTVNCGDSAVISRKSESSVKWLVLPWQVLASSDKGVLSTIENSLSTCTDLSVKMEFCQFITNIMLQDFPAEVLLHRPTAVNILLVLLESHKNESNYDSKNLIIVILKTLYRLTRSLRFRIYYYCDPSIAHKAQMILARNLENERSIPQGRDSPEEPTEEHYRPHHPTRSNNRSPSSIDDVDDAVLQLQQMIIPNYCTETLISTLKLLSIPNDSNRPLQTVRHIADLVYELIQLLVTSVMPTVWFCNDNIALKIHENIKTLFELLSEILDYFEQFSSVDYYRTIYVYFLWLTIKLMSNIMPLELADQVIPKRMKLSICVAMMDAPIYLMYPSLHATLQEYARRFHGTQECEMVKLLDETRLIVKSMKAAISLMKEVKELSYSEELKLIYLSKLSLLYHKNFKLIRKFIKLAQNKAGYILGKEDKETTTKMILTLLAHSDEEIQETTYTECSSLVTGILGVEYNGRSNWKNLIFLLESNVLTEIVCHGAAHENKKIQNMAENILLCFLKGKIQLGESGWLYFLEAMIPVLPLLQCFADPSTPLGKSVIKMLDPDIFSTIKLPFIEVLKGNIRLLFSSISDTRDEALCRLLWLLDQEKNSNQKLPRLTSLHGLPLSSLCIFEKQKCAKRAEGTYQKSALISVLEMLQSSNIEPKMRKSALVQVSVMLSDTSLHKLFMTENGLPLILDIFSKALIERDCSNYPDSVMSILTILKLLASSESSIRIELSNHIDIYYNILRSLFLYPNNESVKVDGAQLLALILFNGYIMRLTEKSVNNPFNISLPYLITINTRLPFTCKAHWKSSIHRRVDVSILHRNNPIALTFIRIFWAWEWNGGEKVLWKKWEEINDPMITEHLMLRENEFACMTFSSLDFCLQQQLFKIQNSITHNGVSSAIDYLTMYLKLCDVLNYDYSETDVQLPWAHTFDRFLQSHPTNKEDNELFIDVLNFLRLYIKTSKNDALWLCKSIKNMMKSLSEWLNNTEDGNENVHQSILRLIRACSIVDIQETNELKNSWINFVEFAVSNLFYGEYYNIVFLHWVLSTLTYVIGKCQWKNNKNTLLSIGNALIELILSFHPEEIVSFMGLTITRDCIICLNHILYQMQNTLNKNLWTKFWYDDGQSLSWLPALWKSRDPLVRASALQLLANLMNGPHTALQLLNAIQSSPDELCHSLLYFITSHEESCIVKEEACLAMSHLIKNSNTIVFQYVDSLKPSAILNYVKDNNVYHEIVVMFSNCYMLATLDPDMSESAEIQVSQTQSLASSRATTVSMVPKTIYYLYNCAEEFQKYSAGNSDFTDDEDQLQFISTPTLMTTLCLMLNHLIAIGEHEVIHEIFEHSLYKHIIGCFGEIPKNINGPRNLDHYNSVLEMYTSLCTVLTNCIIHSADFASIVIFSSDFIHQLFELLNGDLYFTNTRNLINLRNRLCAEILKLLVSLSLTESQHMDSIQGALEICNAESLMKTIYSIIKNFKSDVGMSAIGFLAFLLSLEMEKECKESNILLLKEVLDTKLLTEYDGYWTDEEQMVPTKINRPLWKSICGAGAIENPLDKNKNVATNEEPYIGSEICKVLINLFTAFNYAKPVKKCKQMNDKDIITDALTNLLCISMEAKKSAIIEKFPVTCLVVLKEIYINLNNIPLQTFKTEVDRSQKVHPLLHEIHSIYILIMNFMYDSSETKEIFTKAGLADIIHKLWIHSSMNKKLLITTLKLLSTFTSNCLNAAQSLSLTTVTPGVGLRKTPNSVSLIHIIVQLVIKEIEKVTRIDGEKLDFAFHILRNAIHNHESRVVISKSNLLQFFPKIHPSTTKRTKLWQVVEINCLEFLIDFTFYDEGQLSVSKATDSLEVLINLSRISSGRIRLLAISVLRNLAFNATNRPRLLGSADFLELLLTSLKEGSTTDIEVAGSALWSLVSNNQKGKLIARTTGFIQCIQTAISRLSLLSGDNVQERELVMMLEYILKILSPN